MKIKKIKLTAKQIKDEIQAKYDELNELCCHYGLGVREDGEDYPLMASEFFLDSLDESFVYDDECDYIKECSSEQYIKQFVETE